MSALSFTVGSSVLDILTRSKTRRIILFHLILEPMTPDELAQMEKKNVINVSRALMELKEKGLVELHAIPKHGARAYQATQLGYMAFLANLRKSRYSSRKSKTRGDLRIGGYGEQVQPTLWSLRANT